MKKSFYLMALAASLLLAGGCTKEEVPADKPLLTENDKSRLRDLEALGFKKGYTPAEYQAFLSGFDKLNVPELDYFNELVTQRSIEFTRKNIPAAEQEPLIRDLELSMQQKKQLNARAMRTYGKTYMHLSEDEFARTAREVGMQWNASESAAEKEAHPSAKTAATNPGCSRTYWCNLGLGYNAGSYIHTFDIVHYSVWDAKKAESDCDYGFQTPCSLQSTHVNISSTDSYIEAMLTYPRPGGFGGAFASQTPDTETRRLLLGGVRVRVWNLTPEQVRLSLRLGI